jgi:hypothetical protein
MKEIRNTYTILVRNLLGNFGKGREKRVDGYNKMNHRETGSEDWNFL